MTEEEYRHRRSHLRSIDPQTADAPPADELEALRGIFIEERTEELMEGLYQDPIRLQEYVLEAQYENTKLMKAITTLGEAINQPSALKTAIGVTFLKDFFEEAVTQSAIDQEAEA